MANRRSQLSIFVAAAGLPALFYGAPLAFKRAFAPPNPPIEQTPADLDLFYEDVWIEPSDGVRLHGWFVPVADCAAPQPGLIVLHGWGANGSLMLPMARHLYDAGFSTLFLDARNHGLSTHDDYVSMPRFAQDLDEAVAWMGRRPGVSKVGVIGHSVGGSAAILSASRNPDLAAVVAVSSFADPRELMQRTLARAPKPATTLILFWMQRIIGMSFEEFAPVNRIPLVKAPVLLVHGDEDEVVPLDSFHALSAAAPGAETLFVPEGGHRDLAPFEPHIASIAEFLHRSLGQEQRP